MEMEMDTHAGSQREGKFVRRKVRWRGRALITNCDSLCDIDIKETTGEGHWHEMRVSAQQW
jgi:hypothetical protein